MIMTMQQGDVLLFQTDDDGDVNVEDGVVEMSGGLETAVYLSLFGGDKNDRGDSASVNESWWGNSIEEPSKQYRSRTQWVINGLPATASNLRDLDAAAREDLEWLLTERVASSVSVSSAIISRNRVAISVSVDSVDLSTEFEYRLNWQAR